MNLSQQSCVCSGILSMFKTILGLASGAAGVAGADGEEGETAPHGAGQTGGVAGAEGEEGETAPHQAGLTGEMLTEKPTLVPTVLVLTSCSGQQNKFWRQRQEHARNPRAMTLDS